MTEWRTQVPCRDSRVLGRLPEWLAALARMNDREVRKSLEARWSGAPPFLRPIFDRILALPRLGIASDDSSAFLELTRSDEDVGAWVGAPHHDREVRAALERLGPLAPPVQELVRHLAGLRQSPPDLAGGFRELHELRLARELVAEDEWPLSELALGEREASVVVFDARNADALLVQPSGRAGWVKAAERRFEWRWDRVEDLASDYARIFSVDVFDSYARAKPT